MNNKFLIALWAMGSLSLFAPQINAEPKNMMPIDILSLPKVSKAELSADGDFLIFQISEVNWKKNTRVSHLWRKKLSSGELRQMTFGLDSNTNPIWSPDGSKIMYTSKRPGDKHSQIYLMHVDGGEAYRLAELNASPKNLKWTEDGRFIYFTGVKEESEKQQKLLKKQKIIPSFESDKIQRLLWRVDVALGIVTQISKDGESVRNYSFSTNGKIIVFNKASGDRIDQRHEGDLWTMGLQGEDQKRLTDNGYYEGNVSFSNDGKLIAYTAAVNAKGANYYNTNLFVLDVQTDKSRVLTMGEFSGEVKSYTWSKHGQQLYFTANIGVSTHLHSYDLKTNTIKQITSGDWTIKGWSYQNNLDTHIFTIQSAAQPAEVWMSKGSDTQVTKITNVHKDLTANFVLPKQIAIQWKSYDGYPIEGLITYPINYKKGQLYPLVVQTHGGPRSSDQYGIWSSGSYMPILAAHGYAVLRTNHRGGTGYGDTFLRDMVGKYFRNAHLDVLSGVDHLIKLGIADPNKLVKMGWSAGGHMTNKIITYTNRFKAASTGAGTSDWLSHYGETDTSYNRTAWFGGKPWQENAPIETYMESSPVKDLWRVKTPTLIFVGSKDVRVPSAQSKILFRGLRDLGVETELYIAPGEPHGFRKLTHRLFKINKELEWFEKHVHGNVYEYQKPPKENSEIE